MMVSRLIARFIRDALVVSTATHHSKLSGFFFRKLLLSVLNININARCQTQILNTNETDWNILTRIEKMFTNRPVRICRVVDFVCNKCMC